MQVPLSYRCVSTNTDLKTNVAAPTLSSAHFSVRTAIDATRRVDSAAGRSGGVSSALIGLGAFYLGITGG